jgi:type IV secretion system protein VirB9
MNSLSQSVLTAATCLGLAYAAHDAAAQIVTNVVPADSLPEHVQKILLEQKKKDAQKKDARARSNASSKEKAAKSRPAVSPDLPDDDDDLVIDERAPPNGGDAITTYEYANDQIYQIRAGLGIATQIELNPSEKILDYSTGFTSGWDLTRRENVFYLKPKNVDVDTNMMIRTETHSYVFELKVVATDWRTLKQARRAGVQYHIRFTYPADAAFAKAIAKTNKEPELSTALLKDRSYNFDYDYSTSNTASPWLVPIGAYDDGRFTYIKMPDLRQFPTGNFPTVHMREAERDSDSLVNTTVEGNTIIAHGTYNYLILRHDEKIVALRRNTARASGAVKTTPDAASTASASDNANTPAPLRYPAPKRQDSGDAQKSRPPPNPFLIP